MASKISITPSDVIFALSQAVGKSYKSHINSFVFDPEDTYERAITAGRVEQFYREPVSLDQRAFFKDAKLLPMIAWNRSNLIPSEQNGRVNRQVCLAHGNTDFRTVLAEFQFNFTYYSTNMIELEQFEVDWSLEQGLRGISKVLLKTSPDMPPFIFSIFWEPNLESINFSLESNYYKSLTGTAKITGVFGSLINDPKKETSIVENIMFSVFDCDGNQIIDDAFQPIIEKI